MIKNPFKGPQVDVEPLPGVAEALKNIENATAPHSFNLCTDLASWRDEYQERINANVAQRDQYQKMIDADTEAVKAINAAIKILDATKKPLPDKLKEKDNGKNDST